MPLQVPPKRFPTILRLTGESRRMRKAFVARIRALYAEHP
jgi:hypothetical protein